ncbi:LysR family transcriptional regulator [Rhizobium skierniewicense]|uniref:LysR family transcriptional regulator n=1 Tax=Rhizobium skierniewicense TaxID=984260 RepID=UPI001572DB50|nr:LysR substrate-binding domain-containing protein [Rhizobium skierniewicense]NTF31224.1 LysR family transcriptional regulator [Rhizobium skierniewicense]
MIPDLPSPLLRSFISVVECGSLSAAAVRLGRSESAISLQMSKLSALIGQPVFDRDGRTLKVSRAGGVLLLHARAIVARIDAARAEMAQSSSAHFRMGVVQDFVDAVLKPSLAEINQHHAGARISIIVGSTSELLQALSSDRIDAAVCASETASGAPDISLPMRWFGEHHHAKREVVPLIGTSAPCPFMVAAQKALDATGRAWHVVLETPSLESVRAAVAAGLGATCRTEHGMGFLPMREELLPTLPSAAYSVIERRSVRKDAVLSGAILRHHLLARSAFEERP